jgi:hypothetical protein
MKRTKVSSVAAILIGALVTVPLLVVGFMQISDVITRATNSVPENIRVSNITETSAEVSWETGIQTQGIVEYGSEPDQMVKFAPEAVQTTNHNVRVTLLDPGTTYYFRIRVGTDTYDNDGVPYTFTTAADGEGTAPDQEMAPPGAASQDNPEDDLLLPDDPFTDDPAAESEPRSPDTPSQQQDQGGGADELPEQPAASCPQTTDCAQIQELLGKECSSSDYLRCVRQQE